MVAFGKAPHGQEVLPGHGQPDGRGSGLGGVRGVCVLVVEAGDVAIRAHVERLEWFARMLLILECPFVIRQPPELRVALRAVASEAAALAERETSSNALQTD